MNAASAHGDDEIERAYRTCARIARGHYENFPVASVLLPKAMRPGIAAIYAFARRADDFADEPGLAEAERLRLLDDWGGRLRTCADDHPRLAADATEDEWIFLALGDAIRRHALPIALLEDLLSAFRQDVTTTRYASWAEVLDYCRRSANPVGRLVLQVAGASDPLNDQRSDCICTALQLTNFWQDFGVDWRRGRLYLPLEEQNRAGADERDLEAGRWTPSWQRAMEAAVSRTRGLFVRGRPLCDAVSGRLRWELRMTWLGGCRVLDKVQRVADPLHHRPRLSVPDVVALLGQTAAWH